MKTKILTALLVATLLASCEKIGSESENPTSNSTCTEVTFTSGIATRAVGTTWESGDVIGISMITTESFESYECEYIFNTKYTNSSRRATSSATFTSDTPLYYPLDGVALFTAYYPYTESYFEVDYDGFSYIETTIDTQDQSTTDKTEALDFMFAFCVMTDVTTQEDVELSFSRLMSRVVFTINRQFSATASELSSFTFTDVYTTGTMGLSHNSIFVNEQVKNDILLNCEDDVVEMILMPQTVSDSKLYFSKDNSYLSATLNQTFEAGKQYNYTLTLGETVELSISEVTITEWDQTELTDIDASETTTYTLSEIDANNIPESNIWIITDSEITDSNTSGLREALDATSEKSLIFTNATSVGENAFENFSSLTKISLPAAKSIGYESFINCTALTSIELPSVETVDDYAFESCSSLTSIELPEAKTIGDEVFAYCTSLTSIELPEAKTIGMGAFIDCEALSNISAPLATTIGDQVFAYCTSLTSIELPEAKTIGNQSFTNCTSLTTIELPEAKTIGTSAFFNCNLLSNISLPLAETIGKEAFYTCTAIRSVYLPKAKTIEKYAFLECYDIASVDLPEATTIGEAAFLGCFILSSLNLPEATTIADMAFAGCADLVSVDLPKVTTIGEETFPYFLETLKLTAESEITFSTNMLDDYSECSLYLHSDYKAVNAELATLGWRSVIYVDSDGNQVD